MCLIDAIVSALSHDSRKGDHMKISKKIGALAAALVMSALLTVSLVGCSGSGQDGNNDFMEKGDGEHLVCAVTGKLIKIAPAILADQLACAAPHCPRLGRIVGFGGCVLRATYPSRQGCGAAKHSPGMISRPCAG